MLPWRTSCIEKHKKSRQNSPIGSFDSRINVTAVRESEYTSIAELETNNNYKKNTIDKANFKSKLASRADPYHKLHQRDNLYNAWTKLHEKFISICHHGTSPTLEEYRIFLQQFDTLLSHVLMTQIESRDAMDNIIKQGPNQQSIESLKYYLSRTLEEDRYFFRNVTTDWLPLLQSEKFFDSVPGLLIEKDQEVHTVWPEGEFLRRAAIDKPEEVLTIILQYDTSSANTENANHRVIANLSGALANMPPIIAKKAIDKIIKEKWVTRALNGMTPIYLKDLLGNYLEAEEWETGLTLLMQLLQIKTKTKFEVNSYKHTEAEPYLSIEFIRDLKDLIDLFPINELEKCLNRLIYLLHDLSKIETPANEITKSIITDYSSSWRASISDDDQNWKYYDFRFVITDWIIVYATRLLNETPQTETSERIDTLFSTKIKFAIFARLKLHFAFLYSPPFHSNTLKLLLECIDNEDCWHEWCVLAEHAFPKMSKTDKQILLQRIVNGAEDLETEYKFHWRARRIAVLKNYLSSEELTQFGDELVVEFQEPDLYFNRFLPEEVILEHQIRLKDVIHYDIMELLALKATNNISKQDKQEFNSILKEYANQRPLNISENLHNFFIAKISEEELYNILQGLVTASWQDIEIENIVDYIHELIEKYKSDERYSLPGSNFEVDWPCVFKVIISLIVKIITIRETPFEISSAMLRVLNELAFYPDPSHATQIESAGKRSDIFNLSRNSVSGSALYELMKYGLSERNDLDSAIIVIARQEMQSAITKLLEQENRSLCANSIIGYYYPSLLHIDYEFAEECRTAIFPPSNRRLREAAWETFLHSNQSTKNFNALSTEYRLALNDLSTTSETQVFFQDLKIGLGANLMRAYFGGLIDLHEDWLQTIFSKLGLEDRKKLIKWFAHSASKSKEIATRFEAFWRWRLDCNDKEELIAFGAWCHSQVLNETIILKLLVKTLEITKGYLSESQHQIPLFLLNQVDKHPKLVIDILEKLTTACNSADFYMQTKIVKEILLKTNGVKDQVLLKKSILIRDRFIAYGFIELRE